jgi:long-chain fatty acid transport protein
MTSLHAANAGGERAMKDGLAASLRALVAAGLGGVSATALGAGFYLSEIGTPSSLGTGGVANPTNTVGADAAWTNPAGMTGIDRPQVLGGVQVVFPSIEFDAREVRNNLSLAPLAGPVRGDDGGNAGEITPIPSLFYVTPLSERARLGFSLTAPLGGGVDYGREFVGRYAVQDVSLAGMALTPSFGYRVTDQLSLGAGLSVIYTTLEQSIAIRRGAPDPALDARVDFEGLESWGVQGILGLTYAFTDRLLLGVVYRSESDADLEGDLRYRGLQPAVASRLTDKIKVSWTKPQWLEAGLRYRLDDQTLLFFNLGWQEWSRFSDNVLSFGGDRVLTLDRNFNDTWHAGIGAVRRLSPRSVVLLGVSYDSSPVKDRYRTLDLPFDETWKLSAAYRFEHSEKLTFAVGATVYLMGDAALAQTAQGVTVRGDYETNLLTIVGATLRYDF